MSEKDINSFEFFCAQIWPKLSKHLGCDEDDLKLTEKVYKIWLRGEDPYKQLEDM